MHPLFSPTSRPPPSPSRPLMSTNGRLETVTCPFSSRHRASVEYRREMAPIPDTPQKPQSHPVIREAQDPTGEAEKDTLRLGNIVPLSTQCGNILLFAI